MEDWIEYFRQEWADIIYHDHYTQLVTTLRSSLCNDQAIEDMIEKFLAELEVSFLQDKKQRKKKNADLTIILFGVVILWWLIEWRG